LSAVCRPSALETRIINRLRWRPDFRKQLSEKLWSCSTGIYKRYKEARTERRFAGASRVRMQEGNGLWIEGAFRLGNAGSSLLRRTQLVGRTQVFNAGMVAGINQTLPTTDTKRTEFGVNYYLNDGWKALASYGRTFTPIADSNIWTVGMTYRFVIPLGPDAMNILRTVMFAVVCVGAALGFAASAAKPSGPPSQNSALPSNEVNQQWMLEGEKRYRTNCGRCHQPPRKYSPRAMAMAVRHMRVRAMLTEDDMRYVLYYVTH
jgi:hypothetical protein